MAAVKNHAFVFFDDRFNPACRTHLPEQIYTADSLSSLRWSQP